MSIDKNIESVINEGFNLLLEELKNGKSDRLKKYLEFCSKFHNYSFNNIIWIFQQMPSATKIASFQTWSKLGYKIKPKSKALRVLRPQEYVYIEEDGQMIFYSKMSKQQKARTSEHKKGITFLPAPVFDISQVEKLNGEDDQFFTPLGDSHKTQYLSLVKIVQNQNIEVVETNNTNGAEGVSYGGLVKIKQSLDYNNKLLTLIHEFAHEILDKGAESDRDKTNKSIRECRAEAVSYIVGNYLDLKSPFSSDYLQNWGNTTEELKEHLKAISKASNKIIKLIEENNENIIAA